MNRTVSILWVGVALLGAGAAIAHEGHQHAADKVMGTVVQVHTAEVSHIEVKTSHGETVMLTAGATTKYLKGKTPAALSDVRAGMRVIATVTKDGQLTKVSEIQLGAMDASAAHDPGAMEMSGDMDKEMSEMNDMMVKTLGKQDANYDHRFIDMMIPHHEGAIMMAKDALAHANKPELKKLAQSVVASQEKEIDQMKAWRAKWYGEGKPNGMEDAAGMMKHMSMMNDMMVKHLGPKDRDYEDRFIDTMIPHHEAAIEMAGDALTKASHPETKRMAQEIIDAQKAEITQLEQWRKQWYGH